MIAAVNPIKNIQFGEAIILFIQTRNLNVDKLKESQ